MPQIAETGTIMEFPEDALRVRTDAGDLIAVRDSQTLANLWTPSDVVSPQPATPDPLGHEGHKWRTTLAGGVQCFTCQGRANQKAGKAKPDFPNLQKRAEVVNTAAYHTAQEIRWADVPTAPPTLPSPYYDELPASVKRALLILLADATFQTVRTDNQALNDFFHGYLAGINATLAIVCGALVINLDFLDVKND